MDRNLVYFYDFMELKEESEESMKEENYTSQQLELFQSLKPGDIVFARMPFSEKKMDEIPMGHKERPYYVIKVNDSNVFAFPCSSSQKQETDQNYLIPKGNYENYKNSYILLDKIHTLTPDLLRYHMYSVDDVDFRQITTKAMDLNSNYATSFGNISRCFHPGDVILFKGRYYFVYQKNSSALICFAVLTGDWDSKDSCFHNLSTAKANYTIDTSLKVSLKPSSRMRIIDQAFKGFAETLESTMLDRVKKGSNKQKRPKILVKIGSSYSRKPIGTIFYNAKLHIEIIYLFSGKKGDYGIYSFDYLDEEARKTLPIRKIDLAGYKEDGRLEMDMLKEVLEYLVDKNCNNCAFIKKKLEELKKE